MYEFHKDKQRYFTFQYKTARDYIIPFIEGFVGLQKALRVLEIGCAEAGVLKAFTERGHLCTGIELSAARVALAKTFMQEELAQKRVHFISKNIYDIDITKDLQGIRFDLIILKDVIEHIDNQGLFMQKLSSFLAPGGKVFFGFPPWQMPFGGHQQIAGSKWLARLPYFHLLPRPVYRFILSAFKEEERVRQELLEIKRTGISIERFESIARKEGYRILTKKLFLFNPIYQYKFNLKPRKQFRLIAAIPYLRNFFSTCAYYLVEKQ